MPADNITSRVIEDKLYQHVHNSAKCYPTLANGVDVTDGGAAWTLGAFATVVAAGTITSPFDIHFVNVESADDNDIYELVIYYGASDTEWGRVRFSKTAAQDAPLGRPIQGPVIPAGSQIRAKVATAGGGSAVARISIYYHIYT